MLRKLLNNKIQISAIFIAIIGLALIRNFEDSLFYDPFLNYFKGVFGARPFPELVQWKLYLHLFFRYCLNTGISLFILFMFFKNKDFLKVASVLYLIFFVVLIIAFVISLNYFSDRSMLLFYIRRFLIQPLFLLLFIPGFYFQQYDLKKQKV